MAVEIIANAPQARCYKCGITETDTVCHECGKPMCAAHGLEEKDGAGKLLSVEFARLGLNQTACGESPVHCEECAHRVLAPNYVLIAAGALAILIGVLLFGSHLGLGILGLLLGGGLAALGLYLNQRRNEEALAQRPALPLIPRLDAMLLREKLIAKIVLDDEGGYHVQTAPVTSTLVVKATFGEPDRERLQNYLDKYKLRSSEGVTFHAGFAVLRGVAGLVSANRAALISQDSTVIPMTGRVSSQPFLANAESVSLGKWRFNRQYRLLEKPDPVSLSVHLIPSLVQETAQRTLQFDLQWTDPDPDAKVSSIHRIELLELDVPVDWGEIENLEPGDATIGINPQKGQADGVVRTIIWKKLSLSEEERKRCRRTFFVRFDTGIDLRGIIRGRVRLAFQTTLSGVKSIDYYYPLGRLQESRVADIKTVVAATFKLSLAGLRYQDVRIVPDPKKANDEERKENLTFEGVIPDHATVIALTNALNDQRFYVKSVIENPPHIGERSKVTNRYWDIAGRKYLSVYPIDFHLILTGREIYGEDIRAEGGTTRTTLTVQGTYANAEMEEHVENVWEQLNDLIHEVLQKRRASPTNGHAAGPQPQPSQPPEPHEPSKPPPGNSERLQVLLKRRDQLVEALISGRLSEKMYVELKAAVDQEINDLQAGD